jgi:hypothetical protein
MIANKAVAISMLHEDSGSEEEGDTTQTGREVTTHGRGGGGVGRGAGRGG